MIQTLMTNDVPLTALDRQIFDATVPADHYLHAALTKPSIWPNPNHPPLFLSPDR